MTDERGFTGVGVATALMAAVVVLVAGCASNGSSFVEPSPDFTQNLGCTASAEAIDPDRKPPAGTDGCSVIATFGVPNRVDRIRIGTVMYQNWLFSDLTVVVRNPDCLREPCAEDSAWEVVYSG